MKNKKGFKQNKEEIIYKIIDSFLAGGLVFLGALSTGNINPTSIFLSFITAGIVALTKFKDYWQTQEKEYLYKPTILFNFVHG